MFNIDELETFISNEIAKCTATRPETIDINVSIADVIGLHGDDFMALAEYFCKITGTKFHGHNYSRDLTIAEWAKILHNSQMQ